MAEIVRRRSWGGVLPLGRHVSISGSRSIHAPSVSIAPSSFQEEIKRPASQTVQARTGPSIRHLGSSGTVNLGKAAPARPFGRAPGAGIVVDTLAAGLRDGVALQIEALAGR